MIEMQLKRGIIISALQADYRMMNGYVCGFAPGGEFRAFSPVVLWALPTVLLSKAFSLFSFSCLCTFSRFVIYLQAESLTHHNLGQRSRSEHHTSTGQRAVRSKCTALRSTRPGPGWLLISNHQHSHPAMLQKII